MTTQNAFGVLPTRIGFGDLTDSTLQSDAVVLLATLKDNGCPQNADADVQAFQSTYVNAGGSLPNDSNGSSGVDGLYGANTAAALQAVINANPSNSSLANETAPAGCVAAASGGSGGGGGSTTFSTGQSASTMSLLPTWGWWTLGLAGLVGLGLVYESMKHHPAASSGGGRRTVRRARRAPSRRRKAIRRRR
jgi:hypothetical protein